MSALTEKIKKLLWLSGDIGVLYLALFLTLILRYGSGWEGQWQIHFLPFSLIYVLTLLVFYIIGLYDLALARNNLDFYVTLVKALLINAVLTIAFFYFIPYFGIAPKTNLFVNLIIFAVLFIAWRQLYNHFLKSPALINNVLILGQNEETKELVQHIRNHPQLGYRIKKISQPDELNILYDLIETIVQEKIQTVVTTINHHEDKNLVRNLYQCLPLKIMVSDLPSFYEKITGKIPVSSIEEMWFLDNLMKDQKMLHEGAKRILDIILSLALGLILLIFLPFLALVIKIDSPGPVFLRRKRVGRDNQIFEIIKFRTMLYEPTEEHWTREKRYKTTKVGYWLKKLRVDELPQAWNVLKGQMSFVGPRPERPEFAFSNDLLAQIPFYQVRHSIKPGLTGWAQIKYPYGSSVKDTMHKLQYDLYYIKNRSIILDVAITLQTIKIIIAGGGR